MLPLFFENTFAMAEALPFFTVEGTHIKLKEPLGYPIVDCHQHLGWTYLLAKTIDYWAEHEETQTYFDARQHKVDLSLYAGVNFHDNDSKALIHGYIRTAVKTKGSRHLTHTAPNLLREMDDLGIGYGALLAIDFPKFSTASTDALDVGDKTPRLLPFVSLHPKDKDWESKLETYLERGARGLKVHGEIQGLGVDEEGFLKIMRRWNQTKLPVLVHSGVSDMQPRLVAGKGTPRSALTRMSVVAETLGDCMVMLGHAGMNGHEACAALVSKHPNLIAEMDGQPPSHLRYFFDHAPNDQLVWGSDWPVYPLALQLARFMVATEGKNALRKQILHDNPFRILGINP